MSNLSNPQKRSLDNDMLYELAHPPMKKQRLDGATMHILFKSNLFSNRLDHNQFEEISKSIDESELAINMNITHFISKTVAEYATGNIEHCANNKCNKSISTLKNDETIYNNNHSNAYKIGYKYCNLSNKYYCNQCMNDTTVCNEGMLHFGKTFECYGDGCNKLAFKIHHNCDCSRFWISCHLCDGKICDECSASYECICCEQSVCDDCSVEIEYSWDQMVCNDCYDASVIKCSRCDIKYKLWYKGNSVLKDENGIYRGEMRQCKEDGCKVWICLNCDEKDRNGKYIVCAYKNCTAPEGSKEFGPYCTQHLPNNPHNWPRCWYCSGGWDIILARMRLIMRAAK